MKKGLLIAFLVVPLLGAGGGYFAATKGMINVPGITPKKVVKKDPAGAEAEKKAEPPAKPKVKVEEKPKEAPKKAVPKTDPSKGIEAVAGVWSNLKADQLMPIANGYKDKDLVPILLQLDSKKTAQLLALMKPDRAAKLSQEIQKQASAL